jgi:hypothetical protein
MTPQLHSHLLGVFRALKARIDLINSSVGHAATQGNENENEIRELLTGFLPPEYGVGTGRIIGTDGEASNQIDIILYDRHRANYTLSADSKLFLADHVYAAIEIKTTFTSGSGEKKSSLVEALDNIKSVRSLKVSQREWWEQAVDLESGKVEMRRYQPSPPLGVVFFFGAPDTQQSRDMEGWFKSLKTAIDAIPLDLQPNLLFSLEHAAFFRHNDVNRATSTPDYSVALVHTSDTKEAIRMEGASKKTKAVVDFCETDLVDGLKPQFGVLRSESQQSEVFVITGGKSFNLDPIPYRVGRIGDDKFFLLDSFRSFLAFLYSLENLLLAKRMNKSWRITDYFGDSLLQTSAYPTDFDRRPNTP